MDLKILAPEKFSQKANLQTEEYLSLIELASQNPNQFWSQIAKESLHWFKDFTEVFKYTEKPFFEWFGDGELNLSYNCIDRHCGQNKTAIIFEDENGNSKSISYEELLEETCQTANLLKKLGVQKGDIVCIYLPLCPEAIIAMHACNRIGVIHTVVFAGFSAQALQDRIQDCKAKILITADGFIRKKHKIPLLDIALEASQGKSSIEHIVVLDKLSEIQKANDNRIINWQKSKSQEDKYCKAESNNSEDTSFILYTSGSTGKPKGIKHSSGGYLVWAHITSKWVFDLKPDDIFWCTADVGWITGHSYLAYGPLSNGATIFIYEGSPDTPSQSHFWSLIDKYQITIFYTAPTAIRTFMQWGLEHINKYKLDSLRLLGTVGEPINPSVWLWFYENIGKSRCPIVDTWWQTETGGIVLTTLPGIHAMKPGSAGLPLPGTNVNITEENILFLNSPTPSMARDIQNDPNRYIETYWKRIPDCYTAGDAAYQDTDGYFQIAGRIDDVINVSGHRLGTAEIESALVAHELVSEAAVISIPHEIKGEAIIAFVTSPQNQLPKDIENILKEQVKSEIGAIARPEKIIICETLPKTRSGKIMRRLLKDIAIGKKPSGDISTLENQQVLENIYSAFHLI